MSKFPHIIYIFFYQLLILFANILVALWFVFFLDMDLNTLNCQGPSKRNWTSIEDLKLVEVLVECHHEGKVTLKINLSLDIWKFWRKIFLSNYLMLVKSKTKYWIKIKDFEKIEYFTIVQVRLSFVGEILQVLWDTWLKTHKIFWKANWLLM